MLDIGSDILRGCNIVLVFVILALLQRANHLRGHTWTNRMRALHQFVTLLLIAQALAYSERLLTDAPPSINVALFFFVYLFGIYALTRKGGLIRDDNVQR